MKCCKPEKNGTEKSRKPPDSLFHQQKLSAWQPILTAGTIFPLFLIISLIFIPIGCILISVNNGISEIKYDYTNCVSDSDSTVSCSDIITTSLKGKPYSTCNCKILINITQELKGDVNLYYGLTNYYQNHRRYVKSRDDNQLKGTITENLTPDCDPFVKDTSSNTSGIKWYAPCGTIANSKFNDTFQLFMVHPNGSLFLVPLTSKGIAWDTDINVKYGTPPSSSWFNSQKPPNWPLSMQEINNGSYQNDEELIVWMRTAALPNFRKLHRRLKRTSEIFKDGLPAGTYQVIITYAYPVKSYDGSKSIIISTTSWMGGKNATLGVVYLIVGIIHAILCVAFLLINAYASKRMFSIGKVEHDSLKIDLPITLSHHNETSML